MMERRMRLARREITRCGKYHYLVLNDRLDGVGRALPDRPEWALARALVSPQSLDWDAAGGLISDSLHYREQVDLGQACATFQNNRQTISTNLRTLENASTTDTEAQLKRALLKNAQDGWQRALTQGRVTFRMGSNETTVEPCAARTVEVTANPVRIQFIAALAAIAFSVTLALLVLIGFRLRRAPRRPAGNE